MPLSGALTALPPPHLVLGGSCSPIPSFLLEHFLFSIVSKCFVSFWLGSWCFTAFFTFPFVRCPPYARLGIVGECARYLCLSVWVSHLYCLFHRWPHFLPGHRKCCGHWRQHICCWYFPFFSCMIARSARVFCLILHHPPDLPPQFFSSNLEMACLPFLPGTFREMRLLKSRRKPWAFETGASLTDRCLSCSQVDAGRGPLFRFSSLQRSSCWGL
jgi:hypothetical protein